MSVLLGKGNHVSPPRGVPRMSSSTSIRHVLTWASDVLGQAGVSSPRVDAEWVLAHVLQCPRSELHVRARQPLVAAQGATFRNLIFRRANRVPLQHLLGNTEFYGLPFYASPAGLIPRPETETLVQVAIDHLKDCPKPRILDLGTGSGIIAIALAKELPASRLIGADLSHSALCLARRNARLNAVSNRVAFVRADLLAPFVASAHFHAILSNPPYIRSAEIDALQPEVRAFDPRIALDGGRDGLRFYREIIPRSIPLLAPGGLLGLEIGQGQGRAVTRLIAQAAGLTHVGTYADLCDDPRAVLARKQIRLY